LGQVGSGPSRRDEPSPEDILCLESRRFQRNVGAQCHFAAEIILNVCQLFRLIVVLRSEFSKKTFSAESDNISRNEKYGFQTPKAYCADCDPKREVQVFAAMHERRL
jgi:hypothetical protein